MPVDKIIRFLPLPNAAIKPWLVNSEEATSLGVDRCQLIEALHIKRRGEKRDAN